MQEIISQLHVIDYINVYLIMFLMAYGFIVKHIFNNIANKYIPYILKYYYRLINFYHPVE